MSTEYKGANKRLRWRCQRGHEWLSTASIIKNHGSWCPACAGVVKLTIEDVHEWMAVVGHVKNSGTWCPICSSGKGERMVRCVVEFIFKRAFPTGKPSWLGRQSLDGYCSELSFAFEYDGRQHSEPVVFFNKTKVDKLDVIQRRDAKKQRLCAENGVVLLRVPEIRTLTENRILVEVSKAIRADERVMGLCRSHGIVLPRKVSPALYAAMHDTGDDGTGQLVMPGIAVPSHLQRR